MQLTPLACKFIHGLRMVRVGVGCMGICDIDVVLISRADSAFKGTVIITVWLEAARMAFLDTCTYLVLSVYVNCCCVKGTMSY
jgi:hypothetical protein